MNKLICALLSVISIVLSSSAAFAAKQCDVGLEDMVTGGGKYVGTLTLQNAKDEPDYATMYIDATQKGDMLELSLPKKHWISFFNIANATSTMQQTNGVWISEGSSLKWQSYVKSNTQRDLRFDYDMHAYRCKAEGLDALVFTIEQKASIRYIKRDNIYMLVPRESALYLLNALKTDTL